MGCIKCPWECNDLHIHGRLCRLFNGLCVFLCFHRRRRRPIQRWDTSLVYENPQHCRHDLNARRKRADQAEMSPLHVQNQLVFIAVWSIYSCVPTVIFFYPFLFKTIKLATITYNLKLFFLIVGPFKSHVYFRSPLLICKGVFKWTWSNNVPWLSLNITSGELSHCTHSTVVISKLSGFGLDF